MNKFKTLASIQAINEGDIIEYRPQNAVERRDGKKTHGYVHHVTYLPQKQDEVKEFVIFPIQTRAQATKSGKLFVEVDQNIDGFLLGLPAPGQKDGPWCIVIDQMEIEPGKKGIGRNDGLVQRVGNLYNSTAFDNVQDKIQDHGGEEKLKTDGVGPRMRRPDDDVFGKYIPLGIKGGKKRNAMTAFEGEETEKKPKQKPKAYDKAGYQPDISLSAAERAGLISHDIVKAFKQVSGLRELKDLAKENPDILSKVVGKTLVLEQDIALNELPDNVAIDDNIVWRVLYPKNAENTPRLETLKQAYDFVVQPGNDLTVYQGVDKKLSDTASKQIIAGFKSLAKAEPASPGRIEEVGKSIKSAWKDFMAGYAEHTTTGSVPARFADEHNQPIWTSVPVLKPRG